MNKSLHRSSSQKRQVGFLGADLPLDLLCADALDATHLGWQVEGATPDADRCLESSFPMMARSIVQQWFDGKFDDLDTVLFTRGNDVSQRIYYYICELQRTGKLAGPVPEIYDVAKINRKASATHTAEALKRLSDTLGISADALREGAKKANAIRDVATRTNHERNGDGVFYEQLGRALFVSPGAFAPSPAPTPTVAERRILLAGTMPPDHRIHDAVSAAGAEIISEFYEGALSQYGPMTNTEHEDIYHAIASRPASLAGPRAMGDVGDALTKAALSARADAVLIWLIEQEDSLNWRLPRQINALKAAGIPVLGLSRRRWDFTDDSRVQIDQFIEGQSQ